MLVELVMQYHMTRPVLQGEFNIIVMKIKLSIMMGHGISQSYPISNKILKSLVLANKYKASYLHQDSSKRCFLMYLDESKGIARVALVLLMQVMPKSKHNTYRLASQ